MIFMKYLSAVRPNLPQDQNCSEIMFDISSIPISTTISDKSFIEHLPQVMSKLVPEFEFQSRL